MSGEAGNGEAGTGSEDRLGRLTVEVQQALLSRDREAAERLLGAGFVWSGSGLGVLDRPGFLATLVERAEWDAFHFSSCRATLAAGSGVVVSEMRQTGRLDGRDIAGEYLCVDVWEPAGPSWLLAVRYVRRLGPGT